MFVNCPGCGGTCPEGRELCVSCASTKRLVATWECIVTKSEGDLVHCEAHPLGGAQIDGREFWEVEVPGNLWTEGHVFYVLRPR